MNTSNDRSNSPINNSETRAQLEGRIGTILKATREDSDMSQRDLAARMGWSRNVIANLETGRRTACLAEFVMISQAMHVDPERLLRRILQW